MPSLVTVMAVYLKRPLNNTWYQMLIFDNFTALLMYLKVQLLLCSTLTRAIYCLPFPVCQCAQDKFSRKLLFPRRPQIHIWLFYFDPLLKFRYRWNLFLSPALELAECLANFVTTLIWMGQCNEESIRELLTGDLALRTNVPYKWLLRFCSTTIFQKMNLIITSDHQHSALRFRKRYIC